VVIANDTRAGTAQKFLFLSEMLEIKSYFYIKPKTEPTDDL